jgi:hypothetical protein
MKRLLFLLFFATGCGTTSAYRVHTSAALPQIPVMPKYTEKEKKIGISMGTEYQKGISYEDQGRQGTSDNLLYHAGVWIRPVRLFVGAGVFGFKTIGVDNDDKLNVGYGGQIVWLPFYSEEFQGAFQLGYNRAANSQSTDNCEASALFSSEPKDSNGKCKVVWTSSARIEIQELTLNANLGIQIVGGLMVRIIPGVKYISINTENAVTGWIVEKNRTHFFAPVLAAGLSYEVGVLNVFATVGQTRTRDFGEAGGTLRKNPVYAAGLKFGF